MGEPVHRENLLQKLNEVEAFLPLKRAVEYTLGEYYRVLDVETKNTDHGERIMLTLDIDGKLKMYDFFFQLKL